MAGEKFDQISAAHRALLLRMGLEAEENGRYVEALDGYRQMLEEYPGSEEAVEAEARLLDLVYLLEEEKTTEKGTVSKRAEKRGEIGDQIFAIRRASLLRAGLKAERKGHYAEALDSYRRILDRYPDSEEAKEVRDRMIALADFFDSRGHGFRSQDAGTPLQRREREPMIHRPRHYKLHGPLRYKLHRASHYEVHRTRYYEPHYAGYHRKHRRGYYRKHYTRHY